MRQAEGKIIFEKQDLHFAERFGLEEAAQMVQDYRACSSLPFLYDTYQLAAFLGMRRKELFRMTRNPKAFYYPVEIPKKSGGVRKLHVPFGSLKFSQRVILREILSHFTPSRFATAYRTGKSICDNAAPHTGKRYLLKLDLLDFFGSITFEQVYSSVFNTRWFPRQIGVMLTAVCCYRDALPQGAPTSPALSNLVMKNFDEVLGNWCEKRGITYTRYCDDMTFSADVPLGTVLRKVQSLLEDTHFELNEKKTRFITASRRQSVTGLTVNEKVSVDKAYKRTLRQEIYYVLRYGAVDSLLFARREIPLHEDQPSFCKYLDRLIGKARYVLSVEPNNEWFRTAAENLEKMLRSYDVHAGEDYVPYY